MSQSLPDFLDLDQCPCCHRAKPGLKRFPENTSVWRTDNPRTPTEVHTATSDTGSVWPAANQNEQNFWHLFQCVICKDLILVRSPDRDHTSVWTEVGVRTLEIWPKPEFELDVSIDPRVRKYLKQARGSLAQPDGSVMLCASALDIMLTKVGINKTNNNNLASRIRRAAQEHIITDDMAEWAHEIRMVANDSRHPEENAEDLTITDAKQSLEFATVLAELLFVLPARVTRGREQITEAVTTTLQVN